MTTSTAYFATGCFRGAERRFWNLAGVISTSVGYMGGGTQNPSYEAVCTGRTGHAEIVEVGFDANLISYQRLLEEFWTMHDPTTLNAQGGDIGTQYRSSIYTTTTDHMAQALDLARSTSTPSLNQELGKSLQKFWTPRELLII